MGTTYDVGESKRVKNSKEPRRSTTSLYTTGLAYPDEDYVLHAGPGGVFLGIPDKYEDVEIDEETWDKIINIIKTNQ